LFFVVCAAQSAYFLYKGFSTEYVLGEDTLSLRSGPWRKRILLSDIYLIEVARVAQAGRMDRYTNRLTRSLNIESLKGRIASITPSDPQ